MGFLNNIDFGAFVKHLPVMAEGMLGIFISIGMIMVVIALLNLLSKKK